MGLSFSGAPSPEAVHESVNGQLCAYKREDDQVHKLLLFGACDSGKSTMLKQMQNSYGISFTPAAERMLFTPTICNNILVAIKMLVAESETFGPIDPALADFRVNIEMAEEDDLTPELGFAIMELWKDPATQAAYNYRRRWGFQLVDSAEYFVNRIPQIIAPDYIPNEQDILRSRIPTAGIVKNSFNIGGNTFAIFDVGVQRGARKTWFPCFEDVTAVVFVAAISAYDQQPEGEQNRLREALSMFDEICNSAWFDKTSFILFLNKRDLFSEKLERVPLAKYFPEYEGDNTYEDASKFIQDQFECLSRRPQNVYTYLTCATDTDSRQVVFEATKEIHSRNSLRRAGLVM